MGLNTGDEMAKQDNRLTQHPLFCVYEDVERSVGDGQGERRRKDQDYTDTDDLCEKCLKLYENDEDLPDDCWECDESCFWNCETEKEPNLNPGVFFTAKACQEHIDENRYHYNNPIVYGIGAWRNPEMVEVMQLLISMSGNEIPRHYR